MKHTPGPWKVHHHSHINKEQWLSILNGAFDITHNGASNPAVIACSKYSAMSAEENLANAKLIAAAPDLLEALKQVVEWYVPSREWDNCHLPSPMANPSKIKALNSAKQAIKRATE